MNYKHNDRVGTTTKLLASIPTPPADGTPTAPSAATETPRVGQWFILKASYCHGRRTPGCTDANPCAECLKSCNRFVIGGMHVLTAGNLYFFAPTLCSRDGDGYMESTHCSVLTDNEQALKDHWPYAHRISEALFIDSPEVEQLTADLAAKTAELAALDTPEGVAMLMEKHGFDKDLQSLRNALELQQRKSLENAEALASSQQRCAELEKANTELGEQDTEIIVLKSHLAAAREKIGVLLRYLHSLRHIACLDPRHQPCADCAQIEKWLNENKESS